MEDPLFDDLNRLVKEFPGIPSKETTSSSATDQFEKELSRLSERQVVIPRNYIFCSDDSYFL